MPVISSDSSFSQTGFSSFIKVTWTSKPSDTVPKERESNGLEPGASICNSFACDKKNSTGTRTFENHIRVAFNCTRRSTNREIDRAMRDKERTFFSIGLCRSPIKFHKRNIRPCAIQKLLPGCKIGQYHGNEQEKRFCDFVVLREHASSV